MRIQCGQCGEMTVVDASTVGKTVSCPRCNTSLFIPSGNPQPEQATARVSSPGILDPERLRDGKEHTAFGWLTFFSIFGWLVVLVFVVGTSGALLLVGGIILLLKRLVELFAAAYIKTNAVRVSEHQLPEIAEIASRFAAHLGQPVPEIYVVQNNVWNALAVKLAGRRMVVLFSGALDSLLLRGDMKQVAWLVGHELGHHFAGHLNGWRLITETLGGWCVWVLLWYKRRSELTCDRYGLACAGSLSSGLAALANMTVGAQLADRVNIDSAIQQWNDHRGEFFVRYRTLYSTHPHTLCRMQELISSAQSLGIAG